MSRSQNNGNVHQFIPYWNTLSSFLLVYYYSMCALCAISIRLTSQTIRMRDKTDSISKDVRTVFSNI